MRNIFISTLLYKILLVQLLTLPYAISYNLYNHFLMTIRSLNDKIFRQKPPGFHEGYLV